VQAISGEKYQSEVSDPKVIVARDVFPPAVPTALTAITGVNTVDLAWNRNLEADFKGYHVYRALEDGPFTRIAELLPAAAYSDGKLESGKRYRYVVTAVDVNGNESARSQVAEAIAP
jgi:fibronectin type 3 domain-containing protein